MTSADCADIRRIGIPRALLYHRNGVLWETFFEKLGVEVVEPTNQIAPSSSAASCCPTTSAALPRRSTSDTWRSRFEDEGCEAVFMPAVANFGKLERFCTKFQALPDLTANTFRGQARLHLVHGRGDHRED